MTEEYYSDFISVIQDQYAVRISFFNRVPESMTSSKPMKVHKADIIMTKEVFSEFVNAVNESYKTMKK